MRALVSHADTSARRLLNRRCAMIALGSALLAATVVVGSAFAAVTDTVPPVGCGPDYEGCR